ncbi:Kelch repeat-containing protein [Dokdonella soli]|uniref:Bulb-type lectin domain-containing protein n=1 Tax=Dokdonella soli TaxID=529810 RepID=A0ABN1IWS0_9GAMM
MRNHFVAMLSILLGVALPDSPCGFFAAESATQATWVPAGNMQAPRAAHAATLIGNGKVLVAGGDEGLVSLPSAELYDPTTRTWSYTGSLAMPRNGHTTTLLPNGKALVAGGLTGHGASSTLVAMAESYDPATGIWSPTGNLAAPRYGHTATLLKTGKVLVAGGFGMDFVASAELYDPATGTWSATGNLATARYRHTATRLQNGKVLVVGGSNNGDLAAFLSSAELYDPVAGTWSAAAPLQSARGFHVATLLQNGKVLVAGGEGAEGGGVQHTLSSVEVFDPATGMWAAGSALVAGQDGLTASALTDGTVLVAGGFSNFGPSLFATATELYQPDNASWSAAGNLHTARAGHTSTVLASGDVLVAGGYNSYDMGTSGSPVALGSSELAQGTAPAVNLDQFGLTGSWANPVTNSQGFVMEVDPDFLGPGSGNLFAGWFTYDMTVAGGHRWYTIQGPVNNGSASARLPIYLTDGGQFDTAQATTTTPVGQAILQFSDCMHGMLNYAFSDGSGRTGTIPLTRLLANVTCGPTGDNGNAGKSYLFSGAWADLATSGQGLVFDINPVQGVLFAAWYTYFADAAPGSGPAEQHWYTLQALLMPGISTLNDVGIYETIGGVFDQAANTSTHQVGTATLTPHSCTSTTMTFNFTAGPNAGRSGTLNLTRIAPPPAGCHS